MTALRYAAIDHNTNWILGEVAAAQIMQGAQPVVDDFVKFVSTAYEFGPQTYEVYEIADGGEIPSGPYLELVERVEAGRFVGRVRVYAHPDTW